MNAVSATDLRKSFGGVTALDGVSLQIRAGEFYGLLGPNGAGKTTLLRILCGLLKPDSGDIALDRMRDGIPAVGVVPQEIALYDALTARQNLLIFGKLSGLSGQRLNARIAEVLDAVGLADRAAHKVKTYSGGMKRRLNLAVGLLSDPPVVLLDEPTVGVDPQSRARIFTLLHDLHKSGKTLIYTTHYMEEAERLCERIGIMDHGRVLAEGSLTSLLNLVHTPRVVRVHGNFPADLPQLDYASSERDGGHTDYTPRRPEDLGGLVSRITACGLPFDRLEITGPDLEALFLELTGKELRN